MINRRATRNGCSLFLKATGSAHNMNIGDMKEGGNRRSPLGKWRDRLCPKSMVPQGNVMHYWSLAIHHLREPIM